MVDCTSPARKTAWTASIRLAVWSFGRYVACNANKNVFLSERGAPMGLAGFRRMVARLGEAAKIPFQVHPHMLRHGCGYKLANQGVDTRSLQHYLGHKNIQHTVRYSELSPNRFKDFWRD